jgi:hemerythrin-like domain-containing protein
MLTKLKVETNSSERIQEDAVTLLLACHDRIRHFTELAERLARNPGSPARDRQEAAGAVLRYYQFGLPLHEADENESIYPRLHRKLPPGYLAAANESMVQQHTAIDALVAELLPLWQAIADNPEAQKRVSNELRDRVKQLQQLWTTHLRLEEQDVVPAMRAFLSEQDLKAIATEMRARRQTT